MAIRNEDIYGTEVIVKKYFELKKTCQMGVFTWCHSMV